MTETRRAVVSALELCRVLYPGAASTSGRARDYLRRIDRAFADARYRATIESAPGGGIRVISDDAAQVYNVPAACISRVVVRWLD